MTNLLFLVLLSSSEMEMTSMTLTQNVATETQRRSTQQISSYTGFRKTLSCHPFLEEFTLAPNPIPVDTYVKRPSLISYDEKDSTSISELMLEEARICEILREHPHPNIAQYLGCLVENGRISGLVSSSTIQLSPSDSPIQIAPFRSINAGKASNTALNTSRISVSSTMM